jgi:tetratricopeptide (TPR) repeat protein
MPKGSIYFGGTDHGRFVITTVNALQEPPPVFCITQNALADDIYATYLRAIYGNSIWIPKKENSMQAFQQYMNKVLSEKRGTNSVIMTEDGRVQVSGVLGVMEINGILCKMIFDYNKDSHEFFVEESYIIDWMYPYLEPCGLIMKLNTRPLDGLDDNTVQRDQKFWREYVVRLQQHPRFGKNTEAQKAFAKLRCAIASIYVFRKRYEDARAAFYEAMKLCPVCPEASFRLARLYEEQGKIESAIGVMKKYVALDDQTLVRYGEINPLYSQDKAKDYIRELEEKYKRSSTRSQTDAEQPPAN